MTVTRNFTLFQYFNFEKKIWKRKTFFKKLEPCFLVESIKSENASFSYKTAMTEANVKTDKVGNTKQTFHKERDFAGN